MNFGVGFLGPWETIVVIAIIVLLFGARNLFKPPERNETQPPNHHPVLMGITFVLGAVSVGLVLYEILK